jgi:aminopeptidase 2
MGASEDPKLLEETLQYVLTEVRDQDVVYFFQGLESNYKARRLLAQFFKDHYDTVNCSDD